MKLRNKKTGEYGRLNCIRENEKSWFEVKTKGNIYKYNSLTKLNEDWQDYEEQCWYITSSGEVREGVLDADWRDERRIGNYFETKEEAEKAVEKLKAWKRLKDKGFMCIYREKGLHFKAEFDMVDKPLLDAALQADLDLLFGGEE